MNLDELITALTEQVLAKLNECRKQRFLLLGEGCFPRLEREVELVPLTAGEDGTNCEGAVVTQLSLEELGGLAMGYSPTPRGTALLRMLLKGKPVWAAAEGIELLAPGWATESAYYRLLREKLELLEGCGLILCRHGSLEEAVLRREIRQGGIHLEKRVITERDVLHVSEQGEQAISVPHNAILTGLAQEKAGELGIAIRREKGRRER